MFRYFLKIWYFSCCFSLVGNIGFGMTASASPFFTSDLAGTWDFHMLTSGDSPQWTGWAYGSWDIGTDGVASSTSITKSDGNSDLPPDSQMSVSSSGTITISGTDFHGVMNAEKDMVTGVMTDGGGGYSLLIYSKRSVVSYETSNLEGTWDFHMLTSGDSPQWTGWIYGSWNVGTNGVTSWTSITKSDGNSALPPDSQMSVSSSGAVTISGTNFHGVMNAEKDMVTGVMTDGGNGYSLLICSKRSVVSYETSNLEGTWDFHMLASGNSPQWTGWIYGSWNVGTNGVTFWTSITKSDRNSALPPDSQMSVSSSGTVTIPETDFHGVMNVGKDMIVGTMTDGGGGYSLLMFIKHQRTNSFIPQMLLLLLGT